MTKPLPPPDSELRYRRHLIRAMDRQSLLEKIVREHLQARESNRNGSPIAELYGIPVERHA